MVEIHSQILSIQRDTSADIYLYQAIKMIATTTIATERILPSKTVLLHLQSGNQTLTGHFALTWRISKPRQQAPG